MPRNDDTRPSPDHLLTLVHRDQVRKSRGHLKVFLGMVAGVGKTYAMLQRAHQLKAQGVDIVVGWIDTHGRKDTEALAEGLEVVPPLTIAHRGVTLREMDLDKILERKPKVVIVDELAHSNPPGLRHEKRYLDVLEILKAGIDVFTAVNIQHLESRVDTVREITGVSVKETVPDSILDQADEVALIDLPAEDLLVRLKEGRIYGADRAEVAGRNFFTLGNLTALRELALRTATDRVDREVRDFKTLHGIEEAWKSSPRLMVGVFASPYSETLIRWTRQLAYTMKGTWLGVYVNTGDPLSEDEKRLLEKNTGLVRQLGGEFIGIEDQSLVEGLLRVGRQHNVTQLIVGKSQRSGWRNLLRGGSIVYRLLRNSGDIDVYAVSTRDKASAGYHKIKKTPWSDLYPWHELVWALLATFFASLVALTLNPLIGYESVGILFLVFVTLSGLVMSRPSVFFVAVALSLVHNFFFIPPLFTFTIDKPQDALMFVMYFLAASTVGHLTTRLKKQNRIIRNREDRTVQLYQLAQSIAQAKDLDSIILLAVETFNQIFGAELTFVFFSSDGAPMVHRHSAFAPDDRDAAVAQWVRTNASIAGRFTETLPSASATYFPIQTKETTLGAVGIAFPPGFNFTFEVRNFIYSLIGQINIGIEREHLHESAKRLEILEQGDKLYRSLFDSVSHELKTPLTTIRGAVCALPPSELTAQIESESNRLVDVVENMLDMTRIESGSLKPKIQVVDVADVLGPALNRLGDLSSRIRTSVDSRVSPIHCDPSLTVQALVNILRNAVTYSGENAQVDVQVQRGSGGAVEFRIKDNGPGLPFEETDKVFNRFYREKPNLSGGLGLGLSIAKGFVECQGGSISADNHAGGGAEFVVRLPAA